MLRVLERMFREFEWMFRYIFRIDYALVETHCHASLQNINVFVFLR